MPSVTGLGNAPQLGSGGGSATDLTLGSDARGMIARREAATWEGYQAKTSGQILVGDGTDIVSVAVSGDATLSAAGAVTLADPQKMYSVTKTFSADGTGADFAIVGSGVGAVGSTIGSPLTAAAPGFRYQFIEAVVRMDFVTAAYTGGAACIVAYTDGVNFVTVSESIAATSIFTSGQDIMGIYTPNDTATTLTTPVGTTIIGWYLVLRSGAVAFTQPGTAAGTCSLTVYYRLVAN